MSFLCQNEPVNEALITAARVVPHQVARVKLSKTQLRVLESLSEGEVVTAQQISERCELSQSWASSLLRTLSNRSYLVRQQVILDRGGVEYVYTRL